MTRERAIEILRDDAGGASLWEIAEAVDMAIEALKGERQHGEWKADGTCSACGVYSSLNKSVTNFCPNCGAKMKGGDNK